MVTGPTHGGKLARKGNDCLYLRTLPDGDGWLVWDLKLKRAVKSHDMVFFEDAQPGVDAPTSRNRDWFEWLEHEGQTSSLSSGSPLRGLWERRLSTSIHNVSKNLKDPDEDDTLYPQVVPRDPVCVSDSSDDHESVVEPASSSVSSPVLGPSVVPSPAVSPSPLPPSPQPSPVILPSSAVPPTSPPALRRGQRQRKPPLRYGFSAQALNPVPKSSSSVSDPSSFRDAMAGPDCASWMAAMKKEMLSLLEKDVYELVPLPKGKKAIGCWWHYRTKAADASTPSRKKARLVAKGFLQRAGVDYHETYAPSTRPETVRFLLSHIVEENWDSCQMDIMTAFLNCQLADEIYLRQPEGFVDDDHPDWVWRVKASLYGLKQAPREWNHLLTKELVAYGLEQSTNDPVLFTYKTDGKITGALVVHVDDIILAGVKTFVADMKSKLQGRFRMSKVGPLDTYLSIRILRGADGSLLLDQQRYIDKIIEKHLGSDFKPAHVPCDSSFLDLGKDMDIVPTNKPYSGLIGMLQWVANGTRPDIQFAVNRLSQFLSRPSENHWRAAQHVLRYLHTTKDLRLCLGRTRGEKLHGYSDSDWASTVEHRRSTTGWIFKYAGGPISWKSRRKPTVALSSTEGEYMAMSDAAKEAIWLKGLAGDLGITSDVLTLRYDNQGAGYLSSEEGLHRRTKHINVRHHFIRDCVSSGKICIDYVPTADMLADVLTKPLGQVKHQEAVKVLGLV